MPTAILEVWQHSDALMQEHGWDLMVCITELTRRLGDRFFISDVNVAQGVGLISLPALGPVRLRRRVREVLLRVLGALAQEQADADGATVRSRRRRASVGVAGVVGRAEHKATEDGSGQNSYMTLHGRGVTVRLVAGMVRINQPWRLVPSLDSAIAAAVAAGAFGIFYSTIWGMADALSPRRLAAITLVAVAAMVAWLILHSGLWQRSRPDTTSVGSPLVYNVSTLATVTIGVVFLYLLLMVLATLGALTVIPFGYMSTQLHHNVTVLTYLKLGWFLSSMGTFAGALGSSFETDAAIQRATYARREQERHAAARTTSD